MHAITLTVSVLHQRKKRSRHNMFGQRVVLLSSFITCAVFRCIAISVIYKFTDTDISFVRYLYLATGQQKTKQAFSLLLHRSLTHAQVIVPLLIGLNCVNRRRPQNCLSNDKCCQVPSQTLSVATPYKSAPRQTPPSDVQLIGATEQLVLLVILRSLMVMLASSLLG